MYNFTWIVMNDLKSSFFTMNLSQGSFSLPDIIFYIHIFFLVLFHSVRIISMRYGSFEYPAPDQV